MKLHSDPVANAALRLAYMERQIERAVGFGHSTVSLWTTLYDLHDALAAAVARGTAITDAEERARLRAAIKGDGERYRDVDEITDAVLAAGFTYRAEFDTTPTA